MIPAEDEADSEDEKRFCNLGVPFDLLRELETKMLRLPERREGVTKSVLAVLFVVGALVASGPAQSPIAAGAVKLPAPNKRGSVSVEEALQQRRSIRSFDDSALSLAEVGQLLWAAQGINRPAGKRTAPSAGALYPLEVYLVAGRVRDLSVGIYKYHPAGHELIEVAAGDRREELSAAAHGQSWIQAAPAAIVITGVYGRTAEKYGQRAERYVHIEAGHAAQNVYLQGVGLKLGTVIAGAFDDAGVRRLLQANPEETPLGILPIGRAK
jgi:SagB-type dehydrogenase family enzyme